MALELMAKMGLKTYAIARVYRDGVLIDCSDKTGNMILDGYWEENVYGDPVQSTSYETGSLKVGGSNTPSTRDMSALVSYMAGTDVKLAPNANANYDRKKIPGSDEHGTYNDITYSQFWIFDVGAVNGTIYELGREVGSYAGLSKATSKVQTRIVLPNGLNVSSADSLEVEYIWVCRVYDKYSATGTLKEGQASQELTVSAVPANAALTVGPHSFKLPTWFYASTPTYIYAAAVTNEVPYLPYATALGYDAFNAPKYTPVNSTLAYDKSKKAWVLDTVLGSSDGNFVGGIGMLAFGHSTASPYKWIINPKIPKVSGKTLNIKLGISMVPLEEMWQTELPVTYEIGTWKFNDSRNDPKWASSELDPKTAGIVWDNGEAQASMILGLNIFDNEIGPTNLNGGVWTATVPVDPDYGPYAWIGIGFGQYANRVDIDKGFADYYDVFFEFTCNNKLVKIKIQFDPEDSYGGYGLFLCDNVTNEPAATAMTPDLFGNWRQFQDQSFDQFQPGGYMTERYSLNLWMEEFANTWFPDDFTSYDGTKQFGEFDVTIRAIHKAGTKSNIVGSMKFIINRGS